MLVIHFIFSDDPNLGRVEKQSLPQQSLMEMLIADVADKEPFMNEDGSFREISLWPGVSLNNDGEVTEVDWEYSMGNLKTQAGHLHWQWIPETAENFFAPYCELYGSVDLNELPTKLVEFSVFHNNLSGSVRLDCLPQSLELLDLSENKFEGSVDCSGLPQSMNVLYLNNNQLSGSIHLSALPDGLEEFNASKNKLSGSFQLCPVPASLRGFYLHSNELEGEVVIGALPAGTRVIQLRSNQISSVVDVDGKEVKDDRVQYMDDDVSAHKAM